jgi:putative peptide chain release factor H
MSPRVLQVSAGTGPVEVRRFVAQLAEYLASLCAEQGAQVSEVVVRGDEAAPASVEIHLAAAPDSIERLAGTHTLVARSAERGKRSRKRWYAGVQICEAVDAAARPAPIERSDVTITAMRAGGPGGQHVNKTASAVRVFHPASGVTVRVSDERSQHDNVRVALVRLAKIVAQKSQEQASGARAGRRLLHYRVERGRPAFVYEMDRNGGLLPCEKTCSR